jgi:hypothetical protein
MLYIIATSSILNRIQCHFFCGEFSLFFELENMSLTPTKDFREKNLALIWQLLKEERILNRQISTTGSQNIYKKDY